MQSWQMWEIINQNTICTLYFSLLLLLFRAILFYYIFFFNWRCKMDLLLVGTYISSYLSLFAAKPCLT